MGTALRDSVKAWRDVALAADLAELDDAGRLELLRDMEELTRALGAVSVGVQVAYQASQVQAQARAGVSASRRGRAVADELAAARKTSPYWASRDLTSARALADEMRHTWQALRDGVISALQARLVTEATSCLSREDRSTVDVRLAPALDGASTKQIVAAARALTYEVDPAAFVARARKAAEDRGVSIRPAPDVMALLSARLPAPQAIACHTALRKHAEQMRANGDPRTIAQLMADELYARLTGRQVVDGIDVEVGLVISADALFDGDHGAADLLGYGPIPADLARDLLRTGTAAQHDTGQDTTQDPRQDDTASAGPVPTASSPSSTGPVPTASSPSHAGRDDSGGRTQTEDQFCPEGGRCTSASCTLIHAGSIATPASGEHDSAAHAHATASGSSKIEGHMAAARVWLRRLYTDPVTGRLTVRDPRRRLFTGNLRAMLIARARYCANKWCGAPVRHVDHIRRWADGGQTTEDNARGLCARCNLAREHPRSTDPPPEGYLDPPPLLDAHLGRQPRDGPARSRPVTADTPDNPLSRTA